MLIAAIGGSILGSVLPIKGQSPVPPHEKKAGRIGPDDQTKETPLPITGSGHPALSGFDQLLTSFLRKYRGWGASLAVIKEGRLVLARGYGWSDRSMKSPVQPTSLFRIASTALQIHGANGYSEDYDVERHFRDARALPIGEGTTQVMKLLLTRIELKSRYG